MPLEQVGVDVALESQARALGIALDADEAFANGPSRERSGKALSELSVAELTTAEYVQRMKEMIEAASKNLRKYAKEEGTHAAQELADNFDNQIRDKVALLGEGIKDHEKFGPKFAKVCNTTQQVLNNGMKLAAPKEASFNGNEQKNKMQQQVLLVIAIIATLFLVYYGAPIQTIMLAGAALKYIYENGDKPIFSMTKNLASKVCEDKDLRHNIRDSSIGLAEKTIPGLAELGIKDKVSFVEARIEEAGAFELVNKSKALVAALPKEGITIENIKQELFQRFNEILEKSLAENPELNDKLKPIFEKAEKENESIIVASLATISSKGRNKKGLTEKANDMVLNYDNSMNFISYFKKAASTSETLDSRDKIACEKIYIEMKKFVNERYGKPAKDFCTAVDKPFIAEIAGFFGITKESIKKLSASIAKIEAANALAR